MEETLEKSEYYLKHKLDNNVQYMLQKHCSANRYKLASYLWNLQMSNSLDA